MEGPAAWLDTRLDSHLGRQRAQADVVMLFATFSAGIAATLTATTVQLNTQTPAYLNRWALWLIVPCLFFTILVLVVNRIGEVDYEEVLADCTQKGYGRAERLRELRVNALMVVYRNDQIIVLMKRLLWPQLASSGACIGVSIAALLGVVDG